MPSKKKNKVINNKPIKAANPKKKIGLFLNYYKNKNINGWIIFFITIYITLIIKLVTFKEIDNSIFFGAYSLIITVYILSRFLIAYFYENLPENGYEPTVSFVVPAYNEEDAIQETIERIYQINYPKNKMEVIVINDASKDNTLSKIMESKKKHSDLVVVDWKVNKGKRHGMAEGTKIAKGEILIFIDSDSYIDKNSIRPLVEYFIDDQVAAVAGHADVYNANENLITKMQAVRYYVAFEVYKGVESLFNSVTCCSGCFSAYRKKYVLDVIDKWLDQRFLGINCTYGDDRSLTNFLLKKNYKLKYARNAKAWTIVPNTTKKFLKQQLRWKKSWIRESLIASFFMWKKHPIMAISYYASVILPIISPIVVLRALVWYPYVTHKAPLFYIFGLFLMSFLYGVYYYIKNRNSLWVYGVIFSWFYTLVLIWQLPYAMLTLRDPKWGTR